MITPDPLAEFHRAELAAELHTIAVERHAIGRHRSHLRAAYRKSKDAIDKRVAAATVMPDPNAARHAAELAGDLHEAACLDDRDAPVIIIPVLKKRRAIAVARGAW